MVFNRPEKTTAIVTGGAGFIGHHFVEHLLKNTDWNVVVIDKLNYASSGLDRLHDINCFDENRTFIFSADFSHPISEGLEKELRHAEYVFHLGAETHVDRSIDDPEPFVISNVVGTMRMLNLARQLSKLKRFFYFSTDEVYGPAPEGTSYKEWDRHWPGNPYAASKSGAESLCISYYNTYGLPIVITNCMNVFGERQHTEKFIPMTIKNLLKGERILIHADKSRTKSGSRFYIHARNVAAAVLFLVEKGKIGEKYNIVGEKEVSNLELAQFIAETLGVPLDYEMVDFHSSRPGHDLRYALDGSKMVELGWQLPVAFEKSLAKTVQWTLEKPEWLEIFDGEPVMIPEHLIKPQESAASTEFVPAFIPE